MRVREKEASGMGRGHEGKVAVVTGGASGIGQAYARRLAEDGADIAIADLASADETEGMVKSAGREFFSQVCDISSQEDVRGFADAVAERFGRCDILVNNAGIYPFMSFDDMQYEHWRQVMSVNLDSMFFMCKAFVPGMKERGYGRIVNVSSNSGWLVIPNMAHYITSKMGAVGLTRALATELAEFGITVNAVAPSLVRTPTTETAGHQEMGFFDFVPQLQAIKRLEVPDDLVGAVSFLTSEDASFITGQTMMVDGGLVRT